MNKTTICGIQLKPFQSCLQTGVVIGCALVLSGAGLLGTNEFLHTLLPAGTMINVY